jgi:hypothetical protein
MADELEPMETTVPEQADMFRQSVEPDPEPAPPAPEPTPEPVVEEPEPPPVEPDWLSAPTEPVMPPQPEPQYQYQQPPPQAYPQQPQVPQGTGVDAALQGFVDNPDGWLNQRLAQRDQQLVGPIAQQQQQVAFMMNTLMENNINDGVARADGSIRNAYEAFNKDATFRSNKAMQDKIGATLQGMRERATYEARRGNFAPLNALANLSESDIAGTLAYVRAASGVQSPGVAPLQVEGAAVESARSAATDQGVVLDAEQEEAAKRLGPGGRERMIKGILEQQKYDDFETK